MSALCFHSGLTAYRVMSDQTLITGLLLRFSGDPFQGPWQDAVRIEDGAVLLEGDRIASVGPDIDAPAARRLAFPGHLICPGFVDAHAHYPQTAIIASWGKRLIDWLEGYTFPEEARFADRNYADEIAGRYLDTILDHGTTAVASFCTVHPGSVDALFEAAATRGMAVAAGKVCMDRNARGDVLDTPERAYDESRALIEAWHGTGRARYAITPRFAPTSTPEQLEVLGALWAEFPDCLMQTHLSEQLEEIAWVRALFPKARDYLDVYERFGLLGARALFGHAIHLERREADRLAEVGAAVVHCPTSNTFIGSGLFDMGAARRMRVGLATDTGGGSSFSMLRTMAAAYEIAQLRGQALHPAQLLWLATQGSARALHLGEEIGALQAGLAGDLVVLDLDSTPAIAQRARRAEQVWDRVFPTLMMGDDRAVAAVWAQGRQVRARMGDTHA